jgi:hypothetical protein
MHKNVLLLFFIILLSKGLFAQDWNEIYYLEGEAQFLVEEKQYDKAIDIYRRMIREVPEHSFAKYKIGLLYLLTDDQKNMAIEYLEEASQDIALDFDEKSLREIRTPVDVLLYLGEAYQIANRIDEAIVVYNNFKGLIKPDNKDYSTVLHRLKTCENAKQAMKNPSRVSKTNVGAPINNDDSNFGAVISGDGNTIIYTSYTKNYLDNYYSVKEKGVWTTPKRISEKISSKYYLKTASLSYDGSQLYLVTDDPDKNDVFVCFKEGKEWLGAEKLPKTINGKKSNETHASVSKDGKTLYFTSDREGGLGGVDIYKSTLDAKGSWGEAENLGTAINTEFDEATPFVTMDDKYLFFSSVGHNSIGGFDIFYIDLVNKSTAVNLGYPANTPGDELFFVPDNSISSGYISEYDSTSLGKNDIYYISILPKIYFAGNIKNSFNGEEITDSDFDVSLIESKTKNVIKSLNSNNGQFQFEINPGIYSVVINNENYNSFTSQIDIPQDYSNDTYTFEALVEPLETEKEELVAEVVEEPIVEPEIVEQAVSQPEKIEVAEESPKEEIPEPIVEKKIPEKEIEKYVPKTNTSPGLKTYSVQLMALKNPVEVDYFKNVDHVILAKYPDDYYRYTVGNTSSYSEAQKLLLKIHEIGYKDAFIRVNESDFIASKSNSKYTIQIMALIIPVTPEYFKELSSVEVIKGSDDYFRYTIGSYNSYEEAKQELSNIKSLGYNQAFIKKNN